MNAFTPELTETMGFSKKIVWKSPGIMKLLEKKLYRLSKTLL